ncbi:TPA: hypothetical protein ACG5DM_004195 [Pseudomonas putida]|uniref:Uncharacterized protein n=2 Tax=Pseudomonas TaxID=286 RepID=A0AAJ5SD18_9PSED|nr:MULTISPECIES: hypothetical protein [Pseudomonas]MCT8166665.1 hypothetical protein [Pseudomonas sp. HD6422]MCT8185561.1 hypothetical protein [Pseudomonas sp. HD6421]MDM1714469.1 hypothetical protein [Pseudomonas sp. 165]ORL48035.1 hypothetical protein B7H18_29180 [Pseudomonas putida]ORL62888.1 hypothetical protein B7H19_27305 [Pseudomonas putida]
MSTEPFVLRDVDRAQEWVAACTKSCGFESDRCASILASLCGFGSWDIMVFAMGSLPSSACDEEVGRDQLQSRLERYYEMLLTEHEVHPDVAGAIVNFLSPSSGKPFLEFGETEVAQFREEMEATGQFDIEDLFAADHSLLNMEVLAPLTSEPDLDAWYEVFRYLGWDATELEEDGIIGKPSYQVSDSSLGTRAMQVYFIHGLPTPRFDGLISDNPSVALAQYACLGHYSSDLLPRSLGFLLLPARPQLLQWRGEYYCFLGKAFLDAERRWLDILISRSCKDLLGLMRLNLKVKPGQLETSGLAEQTDDFCKQIALLLSGFDPDFEDPYEWHIVAMETQDGWSIVTAVEDGQYEDEHLAPYLLGRVDRL